MSSPASGTKGRRVVDACRDEFTLVVEGGKPKMQCNHCGLTISNHTVTLKNHLARKHGVAAASAGAGPAVAAAAAAEPVADDDSATSRKRTQRNGDDADEHQPATAELTNGDKRRRLAEEEEPSTAAAEQEETEDEADEEQLPLLDHEEFASMNRGGCTADDAFVNRYADMCWCATPELHEADEMREQIIKRSREILKCRLVVHTRLRC